jgi:DNA mismatch endonuclease (patch repair protein)
MRVRQMLHRLGYRFRLHRRDLPGHPDIVLPKYRSVILVHGCFWHRHPDSNCRLARFPKTRRDFWEAKFTANQARDSETQQRLQDAGWRVLVVWECELGNKEQLENRIHAWFGEGACKR